MKISRSRQEIRKSICLFLLFCLVISNISEVDALSEINSHLKSIGNIDQRLDSQVQVNPFLEELAKDTWTYLKWDWATDNHMPWSWHATPPLSTGGAHANVAEIGFYALCWIAAYDLQRTWSPDWATTEREVTAILNQLRAWQTGSQSYQPHGPNAYNGVFYQWYWISWSPPVVGDSSGTNHVVPSVDNAWLAVNLITIREYAEANNHPALAEKANAILNDMDFTLWYHNDTHRFSWGSVENPQTGIQADYFSNENRIINFVARALGQLTASEFQLSLGALSKPSASYNNTTVDRIAWDGSYFTYTAPALFIREMDTLYGSDTIIPATRAQIQYASNQNYAAWGLSDTYDPGLNRYIQQGAPPAATSVSPPPCPPNAYECAPGLVSPHASALALITSLAPQAIVNLQDISATFSCYDPTYGFHNSVMTKPGTNFGRCSNRFYSLEQAWIFLSIANHENGFVWNYFYQDNGVVNTHTEMYNRTISGNMGVAGVALNYLHGTPKTVTSQSNGGYSLGVLNNWSGAVTPSHVCFTFNPISRQYSNIVSNQTGQNYSATLNAASRCADVNVRIGGTNQGRFGLLPGGSTRASFSGLNSSPVRIASSNTIPIIGAERVIYEVNRVNTSFTEMMGLPQSQLDTTYWLPWYNNIDLDTQLRIANVSGSQATITVTIGGAAQPSFTLAAGASTRVSYPMNNGPVKIVSTQNIVAAERVIYRVNNVNTSFTELMGLPQNALDTVYYLPWYNNRDLDTQLRIANVTSQPATVTVTIGGVAQPSFNLLGGASTRVSYPVNNGPVKIESTQSILAAERVIYKVNNVNTSFSEIMALPASQLNTIYYLPWYNNVDLDTQLRIANISSSPATVTVTIGGVAQPSFNLPAGLSTRVSYSASNGPVKIQSTQNIVAAERVIYKVNGIPTSFSEMMGLPHAQLDTIYWLPWYNNIDLDTQLRFGVP